MKTSRSKGFLQIVIANLAILSVLFVLGELALRVRGHQPYTLEGNRPTIIVTPGGKFFQTDSLLGYKHLPGAFHLELKDGYSFSVTHDDQSLRVTSANDSTRPEVWIFGCSFTHGWSVNDEETFPWLVQQQFPTHRVVNFGVNGYGTIHFLLAFEEALKTRTRPAHVVIAHADFHMERNTFSYSRRKAVERWNFLGDLNQPFVKGINGDSLVIENSQPEYSPWLLSEYSALIHRIQDGVEAILDLGDQREEATRLLVQRIIDTAEEKEVPLSIVNIGLDASFGEQLCEEHSVPFADIGVDWNEEGLNNRPYDSHPNAEANRIYAEKLAVHLRPFLEEE